MSVDDLLDDWLIWRDITKQREPLPQFRGEGHRVLDQLEYVLAAPQQAKPRYDEVRIAALGRFGGAQLKPEDLERAEQIFFQVWEQGGPGSTRVLEGMMEAIALAVQLRSVDFWLRVLELARARDRGAPQRRMTAMAALAFLVIVEGDAAEAAFVAILKLLAHANAEIRNLALYYLTSIYLAIEVEPPPPLVEKITAMALNDPSFQVRFEARAAARVFALDLPLDQPDGIYLLRVSLRDTKIARTIAIRADQTLDDLHFAIQAAYGWDADHLYSFYLNGKIDDERFEIQCPQGDGDIFAFAPFDLSELGAIDRHHQDTFDDDEEEEEGLELAAAADPAEAEPEAFTTATAQLGALGLISKHSFAYLFDFGDSHTFMITVLKTALRDPQIDYPIVVATEGEAPIQYASDADWDEDE